MWQIKRFEALDAKSLEEIYRLRVSIFVVEQNCAYQEIDGKDPHSTHIYRTDESGIIAYLRIVHEDPVAIGRVVVRQDRRKEGLGHELMQAGMDYLRENHPGERIYLHAQAHLERFYQSLGFRTTSEVHLEDDIPHVDMEYSEN